MLDSETSVNEIALLISRDRSSAICMKSWGAYWFHLVASCRCTNIGSGSGYDIPEREYVMGLSSSTSTDEAGGIAASLSHGNSETSSIA